MNIVKVKASRCYDIHIGAGLLPGIGAEIAALGKAQSLCIVSDSNVYPLYGEIVTKSLENAGFSVCAYVFPAGEESKSGAVLLDLLNFLAEHHLTRSDLLLALGGGVVGDLTGFAAAVYLRGIRFVQLPTTLLAMVDSSVGGKTAIDLPAGKNLAGAFCQPSLVLCDLNCLESLPEEIFRDGCAEVIKYGILYDEALFSHLRRQGLGFHRESVITRCVELKRDVVAEDEFDTGARMRLNLGHTMGHAVEAGSNFQLSHGKSVAIGTAMIARMARAEGLLSAEDCRRILETLEIFGLPTKTDDSPQKLLGYMLGDKKRTGQSISFIVPRKIGSCEILPSPVSQLIEKIQAGI